MLIEGKIPPQLNHRPGTELIKHSFQTGFFAKAYSQAKQIRQAVRAANNQASPFFLSVLCDFNASAMSGIAKRKKHASESAGLLPAVIWMQVGPHPPAQLLGWHREGTQPTHGTWPAEGYKSTFIPMCPDSHVIISQQHGEANL